MSDLHELSEAEVLERLQNMQSIFTAADFDALENDLRTRAAVLGWTGDPLKQPPHTVLASALRIKGLRP
jgi:hypothetical protein